MPEPRLQYGIVLPNWVAGADVARLVDAAVAAEEAGWDGVFLADHLIFPPPPAGTREARDLPSAAFPDPWIALAGIATRTTRVRLGSWVTPVPRRQPWQLARDLATLDRLSNGRVMLGAGVGRRSDFEAFGDPWSLAGQWERFDEALQLIDAFWRGDPVNHAGPNFTVRNATLLPTPVQRPRIPIVVGGIWPSRRSLVRGARWDGIVPHVPGDGVLPPDDTAVEDHLRATVEHYRTLVDEPGEIMLPLEPPGAGEGYVDVCRELGATWLYRTKHIGEWSLDLESIRVGPSRSP